MGIGLEALREIRAGLEQLVSTLGQTLWTMVCYFYIAVWSLTQPVREGITSSATLVLLVSSLYFLLEAASLFAHEHFIAIPVPLWLKLLIVGLAILMVRHRWHELQSHQRAGIFATTVAEVFEQVAALNLRTGEDEEKKARLDSFISKVLIAFAETFDPKADAQLNVMMLDEQNNLRIFYQYPHDVPYEPDIIFPQDQGGCGRAFVTNKAIYIPSKKFRVGIAISLKDRSFKLAGLVYQPVEHEPYESILSVPIKSVSGEILGILNIDGNKRNSFGVFDVNIAHVASNALAMALDKYRVRSIP